MTSRVTLPSGIERAVCSRCDDFIMLANGPEQRADDAAWFAARHRARHEHEQPPRAARTGR